MNTRSKKYFDRLKGQNKKNADNKTGNDNRVHPLKSPIQNNMAAQDDTGGGNSSGKRVDDN